MTKWEAQGRVSHNRRPRVTRSARKVIGFPQMHVFCIIHSTPHRELSRFLCAHSSFLLNVTAPSSCSRLTCKAEKVFPPQIRLPDTGERSRGAPDTGKGTSAVTRMFCGRSEVRSGPGHRRSPVWPGTFCRSRPCTLRRPVPLSDAFAGLKAVRRGHDAPQFTREKQIGTCRMDICKSSRLMSLEDNFFLKC